jgi:dephospho-CoA kinase
MGLVVSFAGQIGSGKSSVTVALADVLGWRRTGFGDYLRAEIARRGGDPGSREALQDLGLSLVEGEPGVLCRKVLESAGFQPGGNLLVDGVRHFEIQTIIRSIVDPSEARLIFLATDDGTRLRRVSNRRGRQEYLRAEQHRVEAELTIALPSKADAIVNADGDLAQVVDRCRDLIAGWRSHLP